MPSSDIGMSSLKKNFIYSGILTISLYFLQFVTYPYVLRILGVSNLGVYNYYTGFVNFFTALSAMGIPLLGIREISKVSHSDTGERDTRHVFSGLFYLNVLFTVLALAIYGITSTFIVKSDSEWILVATGAISIVANMFTVEWFFRGLENFKFITIRALAIRLLFVVLVFVFIRTPDDYVLYFIFSIASVVASGIINWIYKSKYTKLEGFDFKILKRYALPSFWLGIYLLLGSYYLNIYPVALGKISSMAEVGFFATAAKLTLIVLLLFNAYTQVVIPRISYADGTQSLFLIKRSFEIISLITPPLASFIIVEAPDIVQLIAGPGYEGAVLPMRISSLIVILGCMNQVLTNNILLPNFREKNIVIAFSSGVFIGLAIMLLTNRCDAVLCSICWCISEFVILITQLISSKQYICKVGGDTAVLFFKTILLSSPLFLIFLFNDSIHSIYLRLGISAIFVCLIIFPITKIHLSQK